MQATENTTIDMDFSAITTFVTRGVDQHLAKQWVENCKRERPEWISLVLNIEQLRSMFWERLATAVVRWEERALLPLEDDRKSS